MRILNKTVIGSIILSTISSNAFAADTIGEALSDMIQNVWNPLFLLIAVAAAITGVLMMARGLMKLSEAAQDRGNARGFGPGLIWIAIGAMLIALPDMAGMGMQSVLGATKGGGTLSGAGLDYNDGTSGNWFTAMTGGAASIGAVENCLLSDTPAVCMARNIASNAVPMGIMVIFSLVFLAGLASFGMTLIDMAKNAEGRDQTKGHVTRLVMSVLLMNAPLAFNFVTNTVFGSAISSTINTTGLDSSSSLLTYTTGSTIDIVVRYAALIGYSFTILAFFGVWAYVRGIFMVKGVAEAGRSAGSYGMAGVYMVAGVLMANAKASTCVILNTVGGSGLSAGFCT